MFAVKNTSNVVLSIHTSESDANDQKTRLNDVTLVVVEDTKDNLLTLTESRS